MARTWGRKGRPWRRLQHRVYTEETHCVICGGYVDQTLANPRDRMARSVHHRVPPDVAPDLANARENAALAHYGCNASYGRGQYKGQGSKTGHTPRGAKHGRTRRAGTTYRGTYARVSRTASVDRDW